MKLRQSLYLPLITAIFLGLFSCTPEQDDAISPSSQFVKYYGRNALDVGVDIKYTAADGGLVVLGQRNAIGEPDNSIILYKMDSAGNQLNETEIGQEDNVLYTARKIVVDPIGGGFIIGGTRTDSDLRSFMFTLKVGDDLQPDPSWGSDGGAGFRSYGDSIISIAGQQRTATHRLFDLAVHENGLAIIGGTNDVETNKINFNPATDLFDVSVYILDEQGGIVLSKNYGYSGTDLGQSIIPTGNSSFAIMGVTNRSAFGEDDTQLGGTNILFNIIDAEGQLQQNKIYGSFDGASPDVNDAPVVMVQDGLGFAGMANDGTSNAIMIRLTSTGELIALSNLDLDQSSVSTSLIRTFRGDYIITGSVDTRADTETSVDRGTDMLVMNINQNFTVNTNRVYNYGGEENDVSNGIVQLPSSNLVILGTTDFENGNTMITLMKTNATGRLISN